jgi:hypothetical protein
MLGANMVSDGGEEFLGSEELEIFLVAPMGHGRSVEDSSAIVCISLGIGVSPALGVLHRFLFG